MAQTTEQQPVQSRSRERRPRGLRRLRPYLLALGPGLLAASAGNDAGGIATYASAGADFGYGLLWAMVAVTLCVGVVQEMSARLGAVTGKGFSDLVRENFPLRITALLMLTLLIANFGIIASEFVGIAAATELFGISRYISVPAAALLIWFLITRGSYANVERVFLLLTLGFFAYVAAAFLARPDWFAVGRAIVEPQFSLNPSYLLILTAIVGTTISPYMQLYVQSSVVEKDLPIEDYRYTRFDVIVGTLFAGVIAAFIMIATAATLFPRGISIESAADAAIALEPVAGPYARVLFGLGLLGASLLAAGVLPLATTYMLSEAFGFERGVSRSWDEAPVFLGIFTALIVLGAIPALVPGLPLFDVLVGVYVLNGILLPIELFAILALIGNRELMGEHRNGRLHNIIAWGIAIVVSLLSLSLIVVSVLGWFGVTFA